MNLLSVEKGNIKLSINLTTRNYIIEKNNAIWKSEGRVPFLTVRRKINGKYVNFPINFGSAQKKEHKLVKGNDFVGIESRYSGFFVFNKKTKFTLVATAKILGDGKVDFSIRAENEIENEISSIFWPRPFNLQNAPKSSYSVDTMRQGALFPDDLKENWQSKLLLGFYSRKLCSGDAYMPFWGRVCDKAGFVGIIDNAYDARIFSSFGNNESLLTSIKWLSQLGKLAYERVVHFTFYDDCDYNTFCKEYRSFVKAQGRFKSIDEKIAENEKVKNLIGTPVLHTRVFTNVNEKSRFYKKDGENSILHATFEQRAEQLEKYKEFGLEKLYIHTDGWGEFGYDNCHPYILPPCPQAGGYEGMRKLSERSKAIGYHFGIHDQYRDYYYSCKLFDKSLAVENINGKNPYCSIWDGGEHTFLCSSKALDFVKKTYTELKENNVLLEGTYLDVFSIIDADECFNKDHMVTREECMKYRTECLDWLRGEGLIVSSEEPGDFLVSSLDLVHHAPYAVRPQEGGQGVGIAVPLLNLVYHDSVMVPWIVDGIGGWGIPNGQAGKLHCVLNSQTPYFAPYDTNGKELPNGVIKELIKNVQEVAKIQEKLYNIEMVSHKFLNSKRTRQQTSYADGTVITVDFETNKYTVENKE